MAEFQISHHKGHQCGKQLNLPTAMHRCSISHPLFKSKTRFYFRYMRKTTFCESKNYLIKPRTWFYVRPIFHCFKCMVRAQIYFFISKLNKWPIENPNMNKCMQNFTLFQNYADPSLKNDPLFLIWRFPLTKDTLFVNMGTTMVHSWQKGLLHPEMMCVFFVIISISSVREV